MPRALVISCFDWYKKRLEPIREKLITYGYEVAVLESDFDHIKKSPVSERYKECTYIHVPKYRSNLSIRRIWSHLVFARKVKKYINDYNPDLIHIQIPPNRTAQYCAEYKETHLETKLFLDIVDLWPESMPLGKLKDIPLLKKWTRWRNDCIKLADHIFTECSLYQNTLGLDSDKTSTLYLFKEQTKEECALVKKIIAEKTGTSTSEKIIKFAYLGSMNNIIDIDGICQIISQFRENGYNCELHAIGTGENRDTFCQFVKETGCKTHFYGQIFDEIEKIKILAPCDFAFNMMKKGISVGLTLKSIDYLSYGLPMINNIDGDTRYLVEKEGVGINTDKIKFPIKEFDHLEIFKMYNMVFSKESFMNAIEEVLS